MKRKRKLTVWDLPRLERTPVKREEGYDRTLGDYNRRLASEEAAQAATRQGELERVQKDSSRIMRECLDTSAPLVARFWSQPLDILKTRLREDAAYDELWLEKNSADVNSDEVYDRVMAFTTNLPDLTDEDERRFSLFVACQLLNDVVIDNESLKVMFARCASLGLFKGSVPAEPHPQPRREPVEQPRKTTVDDLLACDDTREGQRRAREISNELWIEEWLPLAVDWTTSLQRHFGFTPTPDDLKKVSNWIEQNNLNRLDPRTYDAARRWMASQAGGYWTAALTSVERHQQEIEGADTSHMTVEQRRQWNVRAQQARESDIRRFGYSQ